MDSINSYLTLNLWPLVNLLLVGIVLYLVLYLGSRIVNAFSGNNSTMKRLAGKWTLISRSAWAFFLLISVGTFIKTNPIVGSVIAGILVFSLWSFLRNFLSGLVLQYSGRYRAGQSVRIDGDEGTIRSMGAFSCELKLSSNTHDIMQIPYRHLTEARITQTSPSSNRVSSTMDLTIPKQFSILEAEGIIQDELYNNSWLILEDQHSIELLKEQETELQFRIVIHGMDARHLQKAKDQLSAFQF